MYGHSSQALLANMIDQNDDEQMRIDPQEGLQAIWKVVTLVACNWSEQQGDQKIATLASQREHAKSYGRFQQKGITR